MKIKEIEISDNYVDTLGKWASVQRTMTESLRLLVDYCDSLPDAEQYSEIDILKEKIQFNIQELEAISPAIDHLHMAVRRKMCQC